MTHPGVGLFGCIVSTHYAHNTKKNRRLFFYLHYRIILRLFPPRWGIIQQKWIYSKTWFFNFYEIGLVGPLVYYKINSNRLQIFLFDYRKKEQFESLNMSSSRGFVALHFLCWFFFFFTESFLCNFVLYNSFFCRIIFPLGRMKRIFEWIGTYA